MPTGYTSDLTLDTPFKDFAIRCARAMGALVMMRDDPLDAPIPDEFPPSDYYRKKVEDAKAKQAAVAEMSPKDVEADLDKYNADRAKLCAESKRKDAEQRKVYERMLAMVREWQPPTADHENFKKFMVEQLTSSIEFDCHENSTDEWYKPFTGTAAEWHEQLKANAARDVVYYEEEWRKEVERSQGRTNWVKALRESLA